MQTKRFDVLTDNVYPMRRQEFVCPYSSKELLRPCEVGSCSFNLADNQLGRSYKRCFLQYQESLRFNPFALAKDKDFDYNNLSQTQRNQIAAALFEVDAKEIDRVTSDFYANLFGVLVEDTLVGIRKVRLSPVPYRQCAVCGQESDCLYYPSGILPDGYGYCSYSCFQLKPPPVLVVEKNMEVDFMDLITALEKESTQTRAKFVRQLVEWVLGNTPMR